MPIPRIDSAITTTINGIDVSDEGTKKTYDQYLGSRTQATRTLRCAWSDHQALCQYLLGGSESIAGTPLIISGRPLRSDANMFCATIDVVGDGVMSEMPGGGDGEAEYERALLTCLYKPPQFDIGSPNQIGSVEIDVGSSGICFPQDVSSFIWKDVGGDIPPSQIPTLPIGKASWTLTAFNRPVLAYGAIMSLVDHLNVGTFFGQPAGAVRYLGARSTRKITVKSIYNWDVSHSFSVVSPIQIGHNYAWRSKGGSTGFKEFSYTPDGVTKTPFYPLGDFSPLFA